MSNDHRYNPVMARRLSALASACDWEGLTAYLGGLSNSQFRTASYILSDETLRRLDDDNFWACFDRLVPTDRKAFLTTFLKAAVSNYVEGRLTLNHTVLSKLAAMENLKIRNDAEDLGEVEKKGRNKFEFLRNKFEKDRNLFSLCGTIDAQKTLGKFLPVLRTVEEVNQLFSDFHVDEPHAQVAYLLKQDSDVCRYAVFHLLRKLDHDPDYITSVCLQLMHRGTDHDFNLVSIVKCYFDLPQVKGRFSLKLNAYELSRLEKSFDEFKKILNRI